jgi:hypothetical protein
MNDEQIKQRIAYLVEHGGLYEDPLDDIRTQLRWLYRAAATGCAALLGLTLVVMLH